MTINQALQRMEEVRDQYGFAGMLETLEYMQDHLMDFDRNTRIAFGVAMDGFRQLLAPAE